MTRLVIEPCKAEVRRIVSREMVSLSWRKAQLVLYAEPGGFMHGMARFVPRKLWPFYPLAPHRLTRRTRNSGRIVESDWPLVGPRSKGL